MTKDLSQKIIELMDLFDGEVTTADQIDRPQQALDREAIIDFNKRNPMAGGGMLVQPNADGSRAGYSGKLKLSEVKKLRADGKTTDQIIKKLKVKKHVYEAFVTANKDKLPFVPPNKINKQRLKFLNEEAVKLGYKDYASVPKTEQKQPGVRGYGPRENILKRATRREAGVPEGKGSPGVKKTIAPDMSGLYTEEARAKQLQAQKNTYQATPRGKRLQWIADNGKNYDKPKDFIKAYEKHFKHKLGSKADALFNKTLLEKNGRVALGLIDNLTNLSGAPTKSMSDVFFIKPNFSEEEIFKASIIQNNPKVQNKFKNLFNDIHNNVSLYSELGPEGIVERLNSGKLLEDFDFINSTSSGGKMSYGGVHRGVTRNSLRFLGIPEEQIVSYQSVRKPLMAISQIIESLQNPGKLKEFGIGSSTAKKISGQLENFLKGERGLRKDIAKINSQLGNVKFNNIFGGINFEHTLAKQFGKDYKYLPRNYLLKGQFTSKAFNMIKRDAFDLPLINLMKQYEKGKISAERVQAFIDDFNSKTNNYADFKFDVDKGKLGYTSDSVTYDLSKYNNPKVARQELIDNIKLTQSDTFQKGMKGMVGSSNQLKLFKSKEAKEILSQLEKLGCGRAAGGRVLYNEGAFGLTKCAKEGQLKLDKILTKGATPGSDDAILASKILKGGALLKSTFALRNIFGPAAIAATVAFEGGLIGYDMLTSGKTLREAFGDNLLNYALGKDYQIDPQEEAFKRYKGLGFNDQQVGRIKTALDAMNTINTGAQLAMDVGQQQEALEKSRGQPQPFMGPDDQMMADTAGQRAEQNLKDAQERLTTFNQSLEAVDRPGGMTKEDVLSEYFSSGKYFEDLNLLDEAQKAAIVEQKSSAGPTAVGKVFPKFEEGRIQTISENLPFEGVNPAFNIPVNDKTYGEGLGAATFIPGKTTGGLFGLAEGGRAGYKLGKIVKPKPSKARTDVKSIIDENTKLMKQMKETEISSDLNQVIKQALDEDLFDKKDDIVDILNAKIIKERKNFPYNQQIQEEPSQLNFYDDIVQSNFRTKTGPFFDYQKRKNKAGGGILKQAGDSSGPPPESGPNSQGLQGLMKRGIKI